MIKHFPTMAAAITDLTLNGFMSHSMGLYVKPGFMASIHPTMGSVVMVAYSERGK